MMVKADLLHEFIGSNDVQKYNISGYTYSIREANFGKQGHHLKIFHVNSREIYSWSIAIWEMLRRYGMIGYVDWSLECMACSTD